MSSASAPALPHRLMLCLSFGQGLALLFLWRALDGEAWPSQTPALNFPLWVFAIAWPGLLLLSLEQGRQIRALKLASLCTAALLLPAIYIGWQASPFGAFTLETLLATFVITMLIACFMGLMHLQLWVARAPIGYAALFKASWRNALVAGLSLLLTGGVLVILNLWGALFAAIGIDFFAELFGKDWFLFPVLAVAFGLGTLIFRRLVNLIDGITGLLEGLMRLLLPLALAVALIFLVALPFTGLAPLWGTGNGTALLMGLNAIALFFLNAVYQTGRASAYPRLLHRLLCPGIALLPILSALALYGLLLRVDQYGWSQERCWAFAICALLALFSLGYAWIIVRHRDNWPQSLGRVNILMGWVVLALMLLVNSPLLDFRKISLASQLGRVEAGEIELREFDFHYAWRNLARPGYLKLQALIEANEGEDPELAEIIREARHAVSPPPAALLWRQLSFRPAPFDMPAGARDSLESFLEDPYIGDPLVRGQDVLYGYYPHAASNYKDAVLLRQDLNRDGAPEYIYLAPHPNDDYYLFALCLYQDGEEWRRLPMILRRSIPDGADLAQILKNAEIRAAKPRFQDLQIGPLRLGLTSDAGEPPQRQAERAAPSG